MKSAEQICKESSEALKNLSEAIAFHAYVHHHENYDKLVSEVRQMLEDFNVTFKLEEDESN